MSHSNSYDSFSQLYCKLNTKQLIILWKLVMIWQLIWLESNLCIWVVPSETCPRLLSAWIKLLSWNYATLTEIMLVWLCFTSMRKTVIAFISTTFTLCFRRIASDCLTVIFRCAVIARASIPSGLLCPSVYLCAWTAAGGIELLEYTSASSALFQWIVGMTSR